MFFPQKLSPRRACPPCSWCGAQSAAITDPLRGLQVKGVAHKPAALCTPSLKNPTLPGSISGCSPLFNPQSPSLLADNSDLSLSFKKKKSLICWFWAVLDGLSLVMMSGLLSSCGARASHCCSSSCCGAQALDTAFSICGTQTLERSLRSCGAWALLPQGLWDLPGPGIELMFPALAGRFLTTRPQGKSRPVSFMYTTSVLEFFDLWQRQIISL